MITVMFEREHKDGLLLSEIYVRGKRVAFQNDRAAWVLPDKGPHVIHWRIFGPTGSTLVVTRAVGEGKPETIVTSEIEAEHKGRHSDATLFGA